MNRTFFKTAPLLLAAGFALSGATAAHAQAPITIKYNLGAFTFTAPTGDASFTLADNLTTANQLTLTQGIARTVNIQPAYFTVNDTSDEGDDYFQALSRSLTVDGITHNATQNFDLTTASGDPTVDPPIFSDDTLTLIPGQVVSYNLGSQGILQFTPETIDGNGFFDEDSGRYQSSVQGKFLLTAPAAVPEASSLVSTGILLTLGLGAFALRARKRSEVTF